MKLEDSWTVDSSATVRPAARADSRAARFTASPSTVYSARRSVPIAPQKASPVAVPIDMFRPSRVTSACNSNEARIARRGSSLCALPGKPKTTRPCRPPSNAVIRKTSPWNLAILVSMMSNACSSFGTSSRSSGPVTLIKHVVTVRSSASHRDGG